jgi:predicted molibdopterin-dependent oxidoreductase YjgC
VLTIGDSIYETHPVYAYELQRMVRLTNKKLVVVSPRWTKMCEWATLWLAPYAGTEELLVSGIARVALEAGLIDRAALDGLADNGAAYLSALGGAAYALDAVSQATGVPARDIVAAAYLYATGGQDNGPVNLPQPTHPSNLPVSQNGAAEEVSGDEMLRAIRSHEVKRPESGQFPPSTIVFSAWGPYTLTTGAVAALTSMAVATGNVGREGAGVNPLVSDANSLGANDVGAQPSYFPGYRPINADNARELEELWAVAGSADMEVPAEPGLGLAAMMAAAFDNELNAMWIVGSNPAAGLDEPEAAKVRQALEKLDFLVVQDIFVNETAELADVILPASSYAEKDGSYTNTERRVQRVRQAIQPVGASKPDYEIIAAVGRRLGVPLPAVNPVQVFAEIASVVPQYAGMNYPRLDITEFVDDMIPMPAALSYKQLRIRSLMWPCTDRTDPGSPYLYANGFATPTGKARLWQGQETTAGTASIRPAGGDVLLATLGLPLFPFRTSTLSRHSYGLSRVEPDPRLHLNVDDAQRLGIANQMPVEITIQGAPAADPVYAISLVYDRVPEGTAFLAVNMEQVGTKTAVRAALLQIMSDQTGGRKTVALTARAAPHMAPRDELQPVATANVLDPGLQPL